MNIPQRVVLVLGALGLGAVLFTTGYYQQGPNGAIRPANAISVLANIWDWQTGLVRVLIVGGITTALFLVFAGRKS